jgi:Fic family protein
MTEPTRLLRLGPSAAAKEKRLAALLAGRDPATLGLAEAVRDAQVAGSLELAGETTSLDEVRAARKGEPSSPAARLLRAIAAVEPGSPLTVAALTAWHRALGLEAGYRTRERSRGSGPPPAPPEFIASRLAILQDWLSVESSRELKPAQAGALAMARILEILPFEGGNGRVARLAASHLMVRAGARPPILVGADAPRIDACLGAAFHLATEPLTSLLEEASERALDVMIGVLAEGGS